MKKNIDYKIEEFIDSLSEEFEGLFPYLYNFNNKNKSVDKVYYSGPNWDSEEIKSIIKTILTGKWISSGENVRKFEVSFSKKFNIKHSLMVNSGSSANLVMIAALKKRLGWDDGDEIILSVVGFPTTLSPIIQNNLKPVFLDIEMDTLNFDLNLFESSITKKTKAVFVSPVLGNPPNFDKIIEICKKYNLILILDNCDSLGSKWNGKYLNEYAYASSCSFYPAHHITTGEGGMVSTDDEELMKIARSISWWGRDCYCVGSANLLCNGTCKNRFSNWLPNYDGVVDHKYIFTNIGYNLKPLDLQGSIGLEQLKKFDVLHEKRIKIKNEISKIFSFFIDDINIPSELVEAETGWFGVPIICKNKILKNNLVKFLEDNGIQTRNYFAGNILIHPAYSYLDDFKKYENSNKVLDLVFFVGCSPSYDNNTLEYIKTVLSKFKK